MRVGNWNWSNVFGADCRSLAVFRIGLGISVLAGLIQRAPYYTAFYTGDGILPLSALRDLPTRYVLNIHLLNDSIPYQYLLLALHVAFALAMTLGWKTRLSTLLCWAWTGSLAHRNPLVLSGADNLQMMMLMWSLFVPTAEYFSLDALKKKGPRPERIFTFGTLALYAQILMLYQGTVLCKLTGVEWNAGQGLYYSLNYDLHARASATWLLSHASWLAPLSYATLCIEAVAPWLLLWPGRPRVRWAALASLWSLHLAIQFFLIVEIFPLMGIVSVLFAIPTGFWSSLGPWKRNPDTRRSDNAEAWYRSRTVALFGTLLLLFSAVQWLKMFPSVLKVPKEFRKIRKEVLIEQNWEMFSFRKNRAHSDGWFVLAAVFNDGSMRHAITGLPLSWEKPRRPNDILPTHQWIKWANSIASEKKYLKRLRKTTAEYLCRYWESRAGLGKEIERIQIYFFFRPDRPPGQAQAEPQRELLEDCSCRETTG